MTATTLLRGFAILLLLQWVSTQIINFFNVPFPPALLGMLLLTALLCTGIIKEKDIEDICEILISKMGMLFIPASVSMVLYLDVIKAEFFPITITIIVSSFLVLTCTALILEFFLRRKEKGGTK